VRLHVAAADDKQPLQWALENDAKTLLDQNPIADADIDGVEAWDVMEGQGVTVGVADQSVDANHPDLAGNVESEANFVQDGCSAGDPSGFADHGTQVAGIVAARRDNGGIAGVAPLAHVKPLRVADNCGTASLDAVIAAFTAAGQQQIPIVTASFGTEPMARNADLNQAFADIFTRYPNTLFVVAAGNDGADVDTTDSYPCAYDLPNIVCVAATGGDDRLASFSDYGARSVDLAAPGVDILSTYPTTPSSAASGSYAWMSGTSMAAPEVTGAAALVLDRDPDLTPWQVHEKLLGSVDKVAALDGKVASGGRLDVAAALAAPAPTDATPASSATAPSPRQAAATTPAAPATPAPATPQPVTAMPAAPTAPAAPAAPAPPAPAADRTAPDVGLSLAGRGALGALLKARLRVPTSVSERASIRIELRLDARTAKRLHLKATATGVRIATGTASATAAGTARIRLRPTRAAKRALARVRRLRVTLTATAADATGNRGTRSRALTITR